MVRYLGARKDQAGQVIEDTVAGELAQIMGDRTHLHATTVIATGSGELEKTNKVKKIFHAASVSGEIGQGYRPIENIGGCVTAALKKVDSPDFSDQGLKSILFPLMGTGTGKGSLPDNAKKLLEAAISYLEANPDSTIQRLYFLTWTDQELETCRSLLDKADEAKPVP